MNPSVMASTTGASLSSLSMPASTSAFRTIHAPGDSLSSSATANCTLTFPAPPPECLLLTENPKNEFLVREKLFQRQPPSTGKSDGSGVGSQLNHTTQMHSRLSGPPASGTHERDYLKQSHLVLEQTNNVFSNTGTVSGASEVLWCGTCGYIHELSSAHKYNYCDVIDTDLLCRVSACILHVFMLNAILILFTSYQYSLTFSGSLCFTTVAVVSVVLIVV
ncbi:hypothetical protein AHF37_09871 [Paragonimus kellicotti]|nr:hypothetical protein AHF37_09871 [Paragonimus kellicotti]